MTLGFEDYRQFRQSLLTHPGERQDAEYKASVPFGSEDDFTLKLLRHIQGMANCGGGWIVIGFAQAGGRLIPDSTHSDDICDSYEPTRVPQLANRYVEHRQLLKVSVFFEPHPETRLRHPVIQVFGFERTPFVCRSTKIASDSGNVVFEQGAVYLRRHNASTSKVSTPEDWDEVIARAVQLRRDETLREFGELLNRMTAGDVAKQNEAKGLTDFIAESRGRANRKP